MAVCNSVHTIFSDSKSSIEALRETSHPLVRSINKINMRFIRRKIRTVFYWVPSHVGIHSNEHANTSARKATEEELKENSSGLPQSDLYRPIWEIMKPS